MLFKKKKEIPHYSSWEEVTDYLAGYAGARKEGGSYIVTHKWRRERTHQDVIFQCASLDDMGELIFISSPVSGGPSQENIARLAQKMEKTITGDIVVDSGDNVFIRTCSPLHSMSSRSLMRIAEQIATYAHEFSKC
ncbi:MAG: hypothetical protein J6M18_02145 [Actinomycetaceae bacterium]|nr:hypothetical protein [Actinomycetaceae bacterium]